MVNNEQTLIRTGTSLQTGTRVRVFAEAVRSRDGRCVITGNVVLGAAYDDYTGFEAAHIFPLAYEGQWRANNFARWITIQPNTGGSINSVQNGIFLRTDIHQLFDAFLLAINPNVCLRFLYLVP